MRASPLLPALLLLVACARAPEAGDPSTPPADAAATSADAGGAATGIERPERDASTRDARAQDAAAPAHADGYAALRFGMDEAALRAAWDGPALQGLGAGEGCRYLSPERQAAPAVLAFMLEGGRFVRYDVGQGNTATAPGGGRIGMRADDVRKLYPGAQLQPHKYVPEGRVLRVPLRGDTVLVFETGADGRVSAWRVGLPPQVDYVEGCS